jgi:hypothetical protein
MSTSGTINETFTARDVVTQAMTLITVLGGGETPSADDAAQGLTQLQWMLKSWQSDGCNLWREEDTTIVVPADTKTVTLDPRVMDIQEARVEIATDYQRILARWERGQYIVLPNKDVSGSPTVFYFRRKRDSVTMTLWPVPTEETNVYCTTARVIEDVTGLDQNLDVPQEWFETVTYNLAARLLDTFGITETRPVVASKIVAMARELYDKLSGFDRPSSVYLQPQYPFRGFAQ